MSEFFGLMPSLIVALILAGGVLGLGLWLTFAAFRTPVINLGDALNLLAEPSKSNTEQLKLVADENSRLEGVGAWIFHRLGTELNQKRLAKLELANRSVGEHYLLKGFFCLLGFVLPPIVLTVFSPSLIALASAMGVGIALAVIGWFIPDVILHANNDTTVSDAQEAVYTFIDLVMLERLANRSSSQALMSAAQISQTPALRQVRAALIQAQLEQRAPWKDLTALAEHIGVRPLADLADIMKLDDQGAAIADTLNERVKELRSAHLLTEKRKAHASTERMTLWMSIPVMIFALAFVTGPLLQMMGYA